MAESSTPDSGTSTASSATAKPSLGHELLLAWLHLAVLWMFAFAKPLFDVLQDGPEFFVARRNTSADIIVFGLGLTLAPPTLLVLCEAALFAFRRARRILHLIFVGVLVAAIALQAIKGWGAGSAVLIALAIIFGAAAALAYARTRIAPGALTVLSPAPFVFLVIFLLTSPVSKLVLPQSEDTAAASNARSKTPVVMIIFDEFSGTSLADRNGHIDASRFPNFAALARDATWYRNATTVADGTTQAVPAVLTGKRPEEGQLPTAADHPNSVFTMLEKSHGLHVEEPITDVCPQRLCGEESRPATMRRLRDLVDDLLIVSEHLLVPEGIEKRLPAVDRNFSSFRNSGQDAPTQDAPGLGRTAEALEKNSTFSNRPERFARYSREIRRQQTPKPALHLDHVELPHAPWQYLPSGHSYSIKGAVFPGAFGDHWLHPWSSTQGYQRYLLQLGFVDRLLGKLVRRLRGQGLYDRALIIVTADHGISFRPDDNRRGIKRTNFADIANVPMFVKAPRQTEGRVDDGPARTIDILPTIAHQTGVPLSSEVDGRPLPRTASADETLKVYARRGDEVSLPFSAFIRARDAVVHRRLRIFGAGDGFSGVFAAGLHPELVGRDVAPYRAVAAPFHVELDFRRAAPGDKVPAFLTGQISGDARGGETVAVAIKGRIAAVTKSYTSGQTVRFGAMVDPATLSSADDVEALVVRGLRPERRPAADGAVERVRIRGSHVTVTGWATDSAHKNPADDLWLLSGRRLLSTKNKVVLRPDLVKRFGPSVARAGFVISAPLRGATNPSLIRVVAVTSGRTTELERR